MMTQTGVGTVFGVVLGSFLAAWRADELRWEAFDDDHEMRRHVGGAADLSFELPVLDAEPADPASEFLADDEATHGRRKDDIARMGGELGTEQLDEARDLVHVLAHLGALEEVAAVQAGAQDEVAGQQGLGIAEDLEDFFLGRAHGRVG